MRCYLTAVLISYPKRSAISEGRFVAFCHRAMPCLVFVVIKETSSKVLNIDENHAQYHLLDSWCRFGAKNLPFLAIAT